MTPRPAAAPGYNTLATRSSRRDDSRGILSAGRSGNIQTNNHRREVGPDQAVTVGPTQVVVLTVGASSLDRRWRLRLRLRLGNDHVSLRGLEPVRLYTVPEPLK